jgi:hypothetical protein
MANPKLFVSYSWTSPDHGAWVLQISSELQESGVEVILDKWDLKEGHDAHAFMEKMVTDPDIKKVILICDKSYVDKTDGRSGGVGTEAQIISGEIYEKQAQDKFVAILTEHDEEGKAYLPAYYRSRIYIDMSDPSVYAENLEQLLSWIFDQPMYKKPELGDKPTFLSQEEGTIQLRTSFRQKGAIDAIRNNRNHAIPASTEYLTMLSEELEKLRIGSEADPFDDTVVSSIELFLPYRDEAIELFLSLALYLDNDDTQIMLHRFFEKLIPYIDRPQDISQWRDWDFDNFRFIVHELFPYSVACLIRHECFESAAYLMSNDYYLSGQTAYGQDVMVPFGNFYHYMKSPEHRNKRLELRRLSLRADLLSQRSKGIGIEFRHIMQADFILFLRDHIDRPEERWHWWPETLLYLNASSGPFEVFARSRSSSYFDRVKVLIGIETKDQLQLLLEDFASGKHPLPNWSHYSFSPARLLGISDMATKP